MCMYIYLSICTYNINQNWILINIAKPNHHQKAKPSKTSIYQSIYISASFPVPLAPRIRSVWYNDIINSYPISRILHPTNHISHKAKDKKYLDSIEQSLKTLMHAHPLYLPAAHAQSVEARLRSWEGEKTVFAYLRQVPRLWHCALCKYYIYHGIVLSLIFVIIC